ncbi:hypothetical protein [Polyangium fumosum]|uniref:Uncharacterized protein n=1 Tax=Polyangium fumosum TaxID=889272 RepID=A0A4U1JFL8_9BACT|nr:hypothetical protein [Polyangium fumosum]TKD10034.1 hypothetical protein E8A74_10565 [Polyangium fumosum]
MNHSAINQLLAALAENPVTEIYIGGTLEMGLGIPTAFAPPNPDWRQLALRRRCVFIEVGGISLFSVDVVVHPWEIDLSKVDRIEPRFDLEDDQFGFIGTLDMVLQVGEPPCHVDGLEFFTFSDDAGQLRLASIGLVCSTDYVFIQGWRINGLRVGCSVARDAWMAEAGERITSSIMRVQRAKPQLTPSPPSGAETEEGGFPQGSHLDVEKKSK